MAAGRWVSVHVELRDEDGQPLEGAEAEEVRYRHGGGELLAGIERALEGAEPGAELTIELAPEDAFGPYQPEGLFSVPRGEFGEEVVLERGLWVSVSVAREAGEEDTEEGEIEARIVEVSPEQVVLDANHPLAGRPLTARVSVLGVEAAEA